MTARSRWRAGPPFILTAFVFIGGHFLTQCHAGDVSYPHYAYSAPSAPKARDLKACDLATTDEVKAALGQPVAGSDEIVKPPLFNTCNYWDAASKHLLAVDGLSIQVQRRVLPNAAPVASVGDLALYESIPFGGRLWVNAGSASFVVQLTSDDVNDFGGTVVRDRLTVLARAIAARL